MSVPRGQKRAVRRDPSPEKDPEEFDEFALEKQREGMHYCWANKGDGVAGTVGAMYARGYDTVPYEKGGVKPINMHERALREGVDIEYAGMVLMQIPEAEFQKNEERGQRKLDLLDRKMLRRRGGLDGEYIPAGVLDNPGRNMEYTQFEG